MWSNQQNNVLSLIITMDVINKTYDKGGLLFFWGLPYEDIKVILSIKPKKGWLTTDYSSLVLEVAKATQECSKE